MAHKRPDKLLHLTSKFDHILLLSKWYTTLHLIKLLFVLSKIKIFPSLMKLRPTQALSRWTDARTPNKFSGWLCQAHCKRGPQKISRQRCFQIGFTSCVCDFAFNSLHWLTRYMVHVLWTGMIIWHCYNLVSPLWCSFEFWWPTYLSLSQIWHKTISQIKTQEAKGIDTLILQWQLRNRKLAKIKVFAWCLIVGYFVYYTVRL